MTRLAADTSQTSIATFSPDGQKFVVVLAKGNLQQNTNEYSLMLWHSSNLLNSPPPEVLLTFSSSTNDEAVQDVRWLEDSETIAFLGLREGEKNRQVYTINIRDHTLRRLTSHSTNVLSMGVASKGNSFAYVAEAGPPVTFFDDKARREGVIVSNQSLFSLIADQKGYRRFSNANDQLFFVGDDRTPRLLKVAGIHMLDQSYGNYEPPSLSPNGRYIALETQVNQVPGSWKEYTSPHVHKYAEATPHNGEYGYLDHWMVVDILSGEGWLLVNDAPTGTYSHLVWSPDSQFVAIADVYSPLEHTSGEERRKRQSQTFTVEVNVRSGEMVKITEEKLPLLRWNTETNAVEFDSRERYSHEPDTGTRILFKKNGAHWERLATTSSQVTKPEIVVEEDMNTPQKIVARDGRTHKKALLLDLNPEFRDLKFSKVQEIQWKSLDGHDLKGGLYYPVDYREGNRYPLVIQTHGWDAAKFWIDGPSTSGFAAQALGGQGMFVLQMEANEATQDTLQEYETELSGYKGGIKYLYEIGMVDRSRVGLIGWSRTCLHVKYAISHSNAFAAAAIADGVDGGYYQYMTISNIAPSTTKFFEVINGGPPFGEGLKAWLDRSPGFNIDKVKTPLRIVAPAPAAAQMDWEWFAALRELRRPVEMVMMKDGEHDLIKPWERMVSQQGNVDWFSFWLKGEEGPDPSKGEQYARWRELRKLQEENEKKSVAPGK